MFLLNFFANTFFTYPILISKSKDKLVNAKDGI